MEKPKSRESHNYKRKSALAEKGDTMDWTTTVNTFLTVGVTLAVCLINNYAQQKRTQNEFKVSFEKFSEMTTFKIDSLASEVREHNQFARRMPVVEEQITTINRRLEALERRVNE